MNGDDNGVPGVVARATGAGRFQTLIGVRETTLIADEPVEVGGEGSGPTPYELLSAALAACTSMTLRLYLERKGWTLPPFSVEVAHSLVPAGGAGAPPRDRFDRRIAFEGALDAAQRAKLLEIADKCPVHRTLMRGFEISTSFGPPDQHPAGEAPAEHERQMEQACAD
jgi:putative redox protein